MSKKTCFVICPIGSEGSEDRERAGKFLKYIIEKGLEEFDFDIIRADKISKPGVITSQIIDNLINADLVIADLYGFNPNVFYELGIRHAVRKPVIQIYHPEDRLPFDVAGLRSIKLNIIDLDSVNNCISELKNQTEAVLGNPDEITSPVSLTIDFQALRSSDDIISKGISKILTGLEKIQTEITELEISKKSRKQDISNSQPQKSTFVSSDALEKALRRLSEGKVVRKKRK